MKEGHTFTIEPMICEGTGEDSCVPVRPSALVWVEDLDVNVNAFPLFSTRESAVSAVHQPQAFTGFFLTPSGLHFALCGERFGRRPRRPPQRTYNSAVHGALVSLTRRCPFALCDACARSQERDVAGQMDGGDGGREADGAVRAHAPHDGGRGGAVDGQARHLPEAVLGKIIRLQEREREMECFAGFVALFEAVSILDGALLAVFSHSLSE